MPEATASLGWLQQVTRRPGLSGLALPWREQPRGSLLPGNLPLEPAVLPVGRGQRSYIDGKFRAVRIQMTDKERKKMISQVIKGPRRRTRRPCLLSPTLADALPLSWKKSGRVQEKVLRPLGASSAVAAAAWWALGKELGGALSRSTPVSGGGRCVTVGGAGAARGNTCQRSWAGAQQGAALCTRVDGRSPAVSTPVRTPRTAPGICALYCEQVVSSSPTSDGGEGKGHWLKRPRGLWARWDLGK